MSSISGNLEYKLNYIIEQYISGRSTNNIGKEFNVNPAHIYNLLKKYNITIRTQGNYGKLKDNIIEIRKLWEQGWSAYKISKHFGCGKSSVLKMMNLNGMFTSNKSCQRTDPLVNHKQDIIDLYQQGKSTVEIAKMYDSNSSSIWELLKKNNIELRNLWNYNVDLTFFDNIDTEEKAWALGLFYTDGNNARNGIRISLIDLDVINKLKELLKYDGPIYTKLPHGNSKKIQYELHIHRKELSDILTLKGCPPAKTFLTKFPTVDILPANLYSFFIRGCIEGDGSVGKNTGITGTIELLDGIKLATKDLLLDWKKYCRHPERNNNITSLILTNRVNKLRFLDFIYKDAKVFMKRKYEKYLEFKDRCI